MIDEKRLDIQDGKKIEGLGFSSLIYPLLVSCFVGMAATNIYRIAKVDSYISAILGGIIGIVPFLLIMYIIKNSNGEDIITLNKNLFGDTIGNIINTIISIIFIMFAALLLYNLSLFLDTEYIPDTNSLYVKILIMIAVVYTASQNISTISRVSQIVFIIGNILFVISFFGVAANINIDNIYPVFENGIKSVFSGSLEYVVFAVFPLILLTTIPTKLINNKKNIFRNSIIMYIISNIVLVIIFFVPMSILGYEVLSIYKYPIFTVLQTFSLFEIIERVENTLGLQLIFCMFVTMVLCIHISSKNIKKYFPKIKIDQLFPTLLGIIVIVISSFMFKNSTIANEFMIKYIPTIMMISFGSIILGISIAIFVKKIIIRNKVDEIENI